MYLGMVCTDTCVGHWQREMGIEQNSCHAPEQCCITLLDVCTLQPSDIQWTTSLFRTVLRSVLKTQSKD